MSQSPTYSTDPASLGYSTVPSGGGVNGPNKRERKEEMKISQKGIQFTITIVITITNLSEGPTACNLHRMRLHTINQRKLGGKITIKKDILQVDAAAAARCTGFGGTE